MTRNCEISQGRVRSSTHLYLCFKKFNIEPDNGTWIMKQLTYLYIYIYICIHTHTHTHTHTQRGRGGGRDSVVGIAICYALDGPEFESRWKARFNATVQAGSEAPYTMGTGFFPGVKQTERGLDHRPHLAPRLKKQ